MFPGEEDFDFHWLAEMQWPSDTIDWASLPSDDHEARREIQRVLVGPVRAYNPGADLDVEFDILRAATRSGWHLSSKYKPFWQHYLTAIAIAYPDRDIHPWMADVVKLFCTAVGRGLKGMNLVGCQNSSKSNTIAAIVHLAVCLDPDYVAVKVTTPFDKTANSGLFGDIRETHGSLVSAHPGRYPSQRAHATNLIQVNDRVDNKYGTIQQVQMADAVGQLKGMKVADKERRRGLLIQAIDEVNENQQAENYPRLLSNLLGNEGFFFISAQNITDVENLGGKLSCPKFGTWQELADMGPDAAPRAWFSAFSSVTLRIDSVHSPNLKSGRDIYRYLVRSDNIKLIVEEFGINSPEVASQLRAFVTLTDSENTVMKASTVEASRHRDTNYTVEYERGRYMFLDPAFSVGGDAASLVSARWVQANVYVNDAEIEEIIEIPGPPRHLRILNKQEWGIEWYTRCIALDISPTLWGDKGKQVTPDEQMVIQTMEHMRAEHVPVENFSYDPSLRASIVETFMKFMPRVRATESRNGPTGLRIHNLGKSSTEVCHNINDEMLMYASGLFSAKVIRGGVHVRNAITHMTMTRVSKKGSEGKTKVEEKKSLKARIGRSPDDRDALCGVIHLIGRAGFSGKARGTIATSKFDFAAARTKFKCTPPKIKRHG